MENQIVFKIANQVSESEHKREVEIEDQIRKDKSCRNESFLLKSIEDSSKEAAEFYQKIKGRKMSSQTYIHKEIKLNVYRDTSITDIKDLCRLFKTKYNLTAIQAYIHRDEGYYNSYSTPKWIHSRTHVHIVFEWFNEKEIPLKLADTTINDMQKFINKIFVFDENSESSYNREPLNTVISNEIQKEEDLYFDLKETLKSIEEVKSFNKNATITSEDKKINTLLDLMEKVKKSKHRIEVLKIHTEDAQKRYNELQLYLKSVNLEAELENQNLTYLKNKIIDCLLKEKEEILIKGDKNIIT